MAHFAASSVTKKEKFYKIDPKSFFFLLEKNENKSERNWWQLIMPRCNASYDTERSQNGKAQYCPSPL